MASLIDSIKNVWNAFRNNDRTPSYHDTSYYGFSSYRNDRTYKSRTNDRSIVTALYTRIAMDVASIPIRHVRTDENGRYLEEMDSYLNERLNLNANIDQTSRMFIQDVVMSMFDEGIVAIVPVDTTSDPFDGSFDVLSLRTGKVVQWYPTTIRVKVYNELTGKQEEVTLPKDSVPLIENPFYSIMNEPNSTLKRLVRKLNLLDVIDEQSGSGKLDLIIQLPYVIKTEARRQEAEKRRKEIENQLRDTKYGIAYTDATEHITQLNRPAENNLLKQIEYLTTLLYSQLGITEEILNGTATEEAMLNYNNRVIEPILSAISNELYRKFLTKTARTQGQRIKFFRDPFRLVPVNQIAEIADKFTRNEIMTSNEIRQVIGMKPSDDPKADELRNSNLSEPATNKSVDTELEDLKAEEGIQKIKNKVQKFVDKSE